MPVSAPAVHTLDLRAPEAWKVLTTSGAPPSARLGHSQAILEDRLYVFGGRQPEGGEGVLYDGSRRP